MDQLNLLQPLSKHSLMSDFECYGGFLPFCLSLDIIELFLNCTSGHRFYQCLIILKALSGTFNVS